MVSAAAGQNMAGAAQLQQDQAAMAERAAREQAALAGYSQLAGQDVKNLQAAQKLFGQQQQAQQGWGGLGLGDKAMEAAARQAYEQAKYDWKTGYKDKNSVSPFGMWAGMASGLMGMGFKSGSGEPDSDNPKNTKYYNQDYTSLWG